MVSILRLEFRLLTPLFLGGADQQPDLRAPAFKGLLRFWYRAIDPDFRRREERFFGGISERAGQSPFLLRLEAGKLTTLSWPELRPRQFDEGQGRNTRNGLVYLGFPFGMRGGEREAFAPDQAFTVRCVVRRERENPEFRRALLAAWWLLGHFGGVGSRSRRGFGSLALTDWRLEDPGDPWPELHELPLLCKENDPDSWRSGLRQALTTIREWFAPFRDDVQHPHLGKAFSWRLADDGRPAQHWDKTLDVLGRRLQDFRQRRPPDYEDVKAHLRAGARQGGQPLRHAPARSSFGLPLTFRYSSVRGSVTFAPYDREQKTTLERQASLLFLRTAALGSKLHPLYLRLDGDVPGVNSEVAVRGQGLALAPARENALDAFMAELQKES